MKKKILLLVFALVCAVACFSGCASCASCGDGGKSGGAEHTHTYDRQTAEQKYLKSAATCTEKAVYYYSCECGQKGVETFEYGELSAHVFKSYLSDNNATCTEDGTETAKCANCDKTDTRTALGSKTGHSFKAYISDDNATCMKLCTETAVCENCKATDTRDIPNSKLKHVFKNYIPDGVPSCTKECTATAKCENCHFATDTIIFSGRLGHSVAEYVSDNNATCTEDGTETGVCGRCGEAVTREIPGSSLGHNFIGYMSHKNATCIKNCTEIGACSRCAEIDIREIADSKIPHYFAEYISDGNATCTEDGTETGKCKMCGLADTRIEVGSNYGGHSFKKYISNNDGSCTENCTETAKCERCTVTDTREKEDSTLHNYVDRVCTLCGERYTTKGLEYELNNDGVSYCLIGRGAATDTEVYIPSTYNGLPVTAIRQGAFVNCSFKSVFIPYSITSIGARAFTYCHLLEIITVDENNPNFKSVDGNLLSKDGTEFLQYASGKIETSFEIPEGVLSIVNGAFYDCNKLKSINISYSVTSIEGISSFTAGSLESITVDENNETYKSIDGNLYSKDGAMFLQYIGKKETVFEIPDVVKIIGDRAFMNCNSLISISIPDGVESIGENAFAQCEKLTDVNIPDSVKDIGQAAFRLCENLTSINIPDSVINIGDSAFASCYELKSVNIPYSVTSIGNNAFIGCESLKSITVEENNASYKSIDGVLYTKDGTKLLQYPEGKEDAYFEIPDGVVSIGSDAFSYCNNLTGVNIPESVKSIGKYAFHRCESLTEISISKNVTSIENSAFALCISLKSITVDENNKNYKSVDGVLYTKDGTKLLQYPIGKEEALFKIPDVVRLGDYAFEGGENLKAVIIPESVKNIGWCTFNTSSIDTVYYCGTEEEWDKIYLIGNNSPLIKALRYYYLETQPTEEGNFWHYGENGEVEVW